MALLKENNTEFGVSAKYWKISKISKNFVTNFTELLMSGFADQDTRNNNCSPLCELGICIPTVDIDTREQAYAYCKTLNEFLNSSDI